MSTSMPYNPSAEKQYTVHPYKLVLWIAIVAMAMMFAGLTSAFIVKKGDPRGWIDFRLPTMFMVSTILVVLSEVAMVLSYRAAKADEIGKSKSFTLITFGLGLAFCLSQWLSWNQMVEQKMFFSGDSASFSFVYVLSGLHLAHIAGGIIALGVLYFKTVKFKVHKKSMLSMQLVATYWHFVGVLWIYLYLFLTFA